MLFTHPFGTSSRYMRLVASNLGLEVGDAQDLFEGTGLNSMQIRSEHDRIDARSLSQMYENAAGLSNNAEFDLNMGSVFELSTHGSLGVAV